MKKRGMKKIGIVLCIGLLAAMELTACGKDSGKPGTKVVFTTGAGKDEVFRIEDEVCNRQEMMVYLTTTQNQYEAVYGTQIWDTSLNGVTLEENVKQTALEKIAQIKTMYLLAKEKGIAPDEDALEKVKQAAEEYWNGLSPAEIELMGISREIVEKLYKEYAYADQVYREIIRDINPEISDDEARTITVQHILIRTYSLDTTGRKVEFDAAERAEAFEKAKEVRELAVDGEHEFTELASKYSEDTVTTYSFGKGEMDKAFEDAAFLLETDEVSQVVATDSGYHIIKCLNTFDREETDANKLKIVEQRRNEAFGQEYDAFVETLARRLNDPVWEEMTLLHDERVTTMNFFDVYQKYFPAQS